MLTAIKNFVARVVCVPPEPHDPMGDVNALRVFRASKQYLYYRYLGWVGAQIILWLFLGLMLLGMVGGMEQDPSIERWIPATIGIIGGGFLVLQFLLSFFLVWLDYEMRWYKVTDRSLRVRYGVMHVREHTVTFANIQNISVKQGPLQRLFGIADMRVETAGGGGSAQAAAGAGLHGGLLGLAIQSQAQQQMFNMHEAVFRGVDNAEEIRDLMLVRLRRVRDAGLGETVETAESPHIPPVFTTPAAAGGHWGGATLAMLTQLREEAAALRATAENATG